MFEGYLELIEEGFFQPWFGQAGVLDEERDRDLPEWVVVQVDLGCVGAVYIFLRRDHSGRVE